MTTFVSNAFSFNMVSDEVIASGFDMLVDRVECDDIKRIVDAETKFSMSARATETLFTALTGVQIEGEREQIKLEYDDSLIVMQYNGPKLEVGCTEVPTGGIIKFLTVTIKRAVWN